MSDSKQNSEESNLQKETTKKRKTKDLSPFLNEITVTNLHKYEVVVQIEARVNEKKEDVNDLHAVAIKQGDVYETITGLTVDQLRALARNIKAGTKKPNLTKAEARYWIAVTAREHNAIVNAKAVSSQTPSTHCRLLNIIFHRDYVGDFLAFNTSRNRATQETGSGATYDRFWKTVARLVNSNAANTTTSSSSANKKAIDVDDSGAEQQEQTQQTDTTAPASEDATTETPTTPTETTNADAEDDDDDNGNDEDYNVKIDDVKAMDHRVEPISLSDDDDDKEDDDPFGKIGVPREES